MSELKFKVGDKVIIIKDKLVGDVNHNIPIGTITTIDRVDTHDDETPYKLRTDFLPPHTTAYQYGWVAEDEIEAAQ